MSKYRLWVVVGALVGLVSQQAHAQRRVTGRVTATTGEPVSQATVTVQNTTIGTYTDASGNYVIPNVPNSASTALVVRRIGFKRTVVPVPAGASEVNIQLEKDVLSLETMVVTGTTTQISSANAPNAVAVVTAQDLSSVPAPTIENDLQGKIPGAIITQNSGAPGGGMQVQIRGITSVNASSSPLYVVDGVIVSNAAIANGLNSITNAGGGINSSQDQMVNRIADINPDDIESIEVLKGASAGAIYGSKASNGVIVITTKRGTTGAPAVNVTQRLGTYQISHELGLRCFHSAAEAQSWYTDVMGGGTLPYAYNGECNNFESQMYSPTGGPSYETDLSVRGGNASTTYYIGGLAKRDNAIQQNTYYQKQSVTANIGQLIGSRINLRSNNEFIHDLTDRGISGNDNSPIVSPGDIFSATPTWFPLDSSKNGVFQPNPFLAERTNPFQDAALVKEPEDVFRYIGSANTTLNAYTSQKQTLDFTFIGGLDTYNYNSHIYMPPEAFVATANGLPGTVVLNKNTSVFANLNLSGVHKYTAQDFSATTSFGLRKDYRYTDQLLNRGQNLPSGVTDVSFGAVQSNSESQQKIRDFSYYGQEEFLTLSERLLLTVAVNSEKSSVNGDPNKYYLYPKYSASYRIPMTLPGTDEIKLRIAYGKAGNQPPYGFAFTSLPTDIYGGAIGAVPSTVAGNPNIKPETSTETEGGADIQFFHGRAALEATAFNKKVNDLILQAAVAPSSGFTTQYINGGILDNKGTEFGLDVTPIQNKWLTWVSRVTYARVAGNIQSMNVPCFNAGAFFSAAYGASWVCGPHLADAKGNILANDQISTTCASFAAYLGCHAVGGMSPGTMQVRNGWDSTWVDATGTNKSLFKTGADTFYLSRARHYSYFESLPRWTMSYSNEFTHGGFRLYGLLDVRAGGKVVNLTNLYYDPVELLNDTLTSTLRLGSNASCASVVPSNTAKQVTVFGGASGAGKVSPCTGYLQGYGVYAEPGGFVKLREITASYTLPNSWTQRFFPNFTHDVRLEVSGRNLWTNTKYTGYDPEVSNFSDQNIGRFQDVTPYPPSRSFFFSIGANF